MSEEHRDPFDTVVKNITEFSVEFFKILLDSNANKNVICSPISTSIVLSMATYGARGLTQEQLRSSLHLLDDTSAKSGYQSLIDALNNVERVDLRLANKIFTASGFTVKDEFKDVTESIFRSVLESVDFAKSVEACKKINLWCEEQTNKKIENIIEPDDIKNAALLLINAVYFKGKWATQFDPTHTSLKPFYVDDNTVKEVPMMFKNGKFNFGYIEELNIEYIELPYEYNNPQDAISMFVILPNTTSALHNLEANLHKIDFEKLRKPARKVHLHMPKFKVECKFDLGCVLQKMGMREMFENSANFKGINELVPLKVSKVVQKAFIEVNEEGSEAAAVTGMSIMLKCMPQSFVVDRPFISMIVAHHTRTQLFCARIADPTLN